MNHPACNGCYFNEPQGFTDGRTEFDGCHVDTVKLAIEQRRQAEADAQDFFAANPRSHGVSIGGLHFTRRF